MCTNQRKRDARYGSQAEPLFNVHDVGVNAELLQECIKVLIGRNEQSIKDTQPEQAYFKKQNSIEFIFSTCEQLRISSEAKYVAIELFNRFIFKHIQDLYSHVQNSGSNYKKRDWQAIMDRIQNQVLLRVVSCCQIASKLTSHYRVISSNRARRYLSDAGHRYTSNSILNSELRILKTLNFEVTVPSILTYLETVLEKLGNSEHVTDIKMMHEVALLILDFVFLKYNVIYNKFYEVVKSQLSPTIQTHRNFLQIFSGNKLILAVSVIAAASFLIDQSSTDRITDYMCKLTGVKYDLVVELATVSIQLITEDGEKLVDCI